MGAAKMIAHLTPFIFLLSSVALAHATRVIGHFGKERIPIDFRFGEDMMVITSHKPVNGHDTFRETSNLHIFSKRVVAIQNTVDKECYIQKFNATMDGMKDKVKYALKNKGNVGAVKEERVMVGAVQPLGSEWVEFFLGPEIAKFCHLHDVYLISGANSRLLDPKEFSPQRRGKRAVAMDPQGISDVGRQVMPVRPERCICRRWNRKRRISSSNYGLVRPRCLPLCKCPDPTDVVIMC